MPNTTTGRPASLRVLRIVLIVLLLALVAYAAILGLSALRMRDVAREARSDYTAIQDHLQEGAFEDALADVRDFAEKASVVYDETHAWYWDLACYLPVLGTDAQCAQGLTEVANTLGNDALMPAIEQAEDILANPTQALGIMDAISGTRDAISSCRDKIEDLPTSHFKELNSMRESLEAGIVTIDNLFDNAGLLLTIGGLLS